MGFMWSILVGIIAGFLAGYLTKGKGFGCLVNLLVGVIGGVLGGWIFSLLNISVEGGSLIGNLVMSTLGAVALLTIISFFKSKKEEE